MKRKIMAELLKWRDTPNKTAITIKGQGQVGKTFIVREFGHANYEHYTLFAAAFIDCMKREYNGPEF